MDKRLKFLLQWSLAISLYLVIEWFYNQHLLTLLSYPSINENQFETTEIFGKLLAAFGVNFVIKELTGYKGVLKFFIGVFVAYCGLTFMFNYFLDNAPADIRYTSYYATMHRKDVIEEKDNQKIAAVKINDWYTKPLLLSSFFMTFENGYWKKYEVDTQDKAKKKTDSVQLDRNKYYEKYRQAEAGRKALFDGWQSYQRAGYKYSRYKNTRYEERARKVFIEKVGLVPDLTEAQFYKLKGKAYNDYLETLFFEGNDEANLKPIYGKDIPQYMSKDGFNDYLDRNIKEVNVKLAPKINEIRANQNSRNALAVILIPPISLVLSFLSIVLNLFFLILLWIDYFLRKAKVSPYYAIAPAFVMIVAGTVFYIFTPKETEYYTYWNQVETASAKDHPVLSFFWNFSLKGEKLLCPKGAPNDKVVSFTEHIYGKK